MAPGRRAWVAPLSPNRGGWRAWATRRGTTDKQGRVSRGPSVSGGVLEGERRERQHGGEALTCGPGQHSVGRRDSKLSLNRTKSQTGPNQFQIPSNFPRSKQDLLDLQKIEIKYGWREFEIRNNFPYKGFLIFEMDFELKFREASMTRISIEILETLEFDEIWLASSLLHLIARKIIPAKENQKFEYQLKMEFGLIL
jgi:hypothetical protein